MIRQKKNKQKAKTCKKVALLGTRTGVGVTHTGILLAEFLKEKMGARVAFLEMNHYRHIEQIEKEIFGYSRSFFSFRGVDYYKEVESVKLEQIIQNSYEYLILDFGIPKKKEQKAIEQCDEKIIIGTLNLWEWQAYFQAVHHFKKLLPKENIKYVISFGNQKMAGRMEKILKEKIWFLEYQPMETPLSVKIEDFFNTLV